MLSDEGAELGVKITAKWIRRRREGLSRHDLPAEDVWRRRQDATEI